MTLSWVKALVPHFPLLPSPPDEFPHSSQSDLWLPKSSCVILLLKSLQWLATLLRIKFKSLKMDHMPCMIQLLATALGLSHNPYSHTHNAPNTLTSFLFLECFQFFPSPGPSYLCFCLPGTIFSPTHSLANSYPPFKSF